VKNNTFLASCAILTEGAIDDSANAIKQPKNEVIYKIYFG